MTILSLFLVIMANFQVCFHSTGMDVLKKKSLNLWRKPEFKKFSASACLKFVIKVIALLYITRCFLKKANKYGIIRHVL